MSEIKFDLNNINVNVSEGELVAKLWFCKEPGAHLAWRGRRGAVGVAEAAAHRETVPWGLTDPSRCLVLCAEGEQVRGGNLSSRARPQRCQVQTLQSLGFLNQI